MRCFYVNDMVTSVPTASDASELYDQATEIFAKAGMKLQKWSTNFTYLEYCVEQPYYAKTLGPLWNTSNTLRLGVTRAYQYLVTRSAEQGAPPRRHQVVSPTGAILDGKLPAFWSSDPALWFVQVEAQFTARRLTTDTPNITPWWPTFHVPSRVRCATFCLPHQQKMPI
ncbi:hypothetical protein MRX96_017047 [Rhipicephalus microplus]